MLGQSNFQQGVILAEKKQCTSSPPPVLVYGVSWADRKVSPYAIARSSRRSRERPCSAHSSGHGHEGNGLSTHRLANAEVPKQPQALPAFLALRIHSFLTLPCNSYEEYTGIAIYNATEEKKSLKNGSVAVEYLG